MPMPRDIKQLRSLLGGLSYYRKFLPNMAKRVRSITALLQKGVTFSFTSPMEEGARALLAELAAPPILVFPDWDAVIDKSRPFRLHCDASTDGLEATLEQEQPDGSIRPIVYISRATLANERNWTPVELEAGCVVWSIRRLRRYIFSAFFLIFTDHECLQQINKIDESKPRIQRRMEFVSAYSYRLSYRRGRDNANANFLSRLPIPPTVEDISGCSALTDPDDLGVYVIRVCGYTTPSYPINGHHEAIRSNCARHTRSRTAILTGNTPLRPDYRMDARSELAASAAPPPPPKATLHSSPPPRSTRLRSTIPQRRPTSSHMTTAPNPRMDHSPSVALPTRQGATPDEKTSGAAEQQLSNTLSSYSHSDWDRAQRADPLCDTTRRYIQPGRHNPLPRYLCDHLPSHTRPEIADIADLAAKGRLIQGDDDSILLVWKPITNALTSETHISRRSRAPFDDPVRIYVPHLTRPSIMHACRADASCHLGVTRTLKMLERFYWWIGVEACTKWWVRRCLKCQAQKTSRQTIRWPLLSIPLPNGPGISVSVDYFGPLPITARGNSYILLFTDRFSWRADMFAVTAAEFTAEGTAYILVNRFIRLWGCPSTLLSDNGLQFCVQLAIAVYKLMGIHKLTTSAYHSSGNGGVEGVHHTLAQMLAMVYNEYQNDWEAHLPNVEYAYNNSVSAATGLAPNEVHIGRLPCPPLTVFDRSYGGVHQSLDRDHLAYCDLARERQQHAYELVREQHALTVARVNGRNSTLSGALLRRPIYVAGGCVRIYNTAATIRQGLRKGGDNKVLKKKLSLNWTGPFKIVAVGPSPAANQPDRRPLGDNLLYLDLPSNLSDPAAKPRVTVA